MAGGVAKTLGSLATGLGSLALLFGLVVAVVNLDAVGDESRKFLPDEAKLARAGGSAVVGLFAAAAGMFFLFVGVPLLVYGFHRYDDREQGRTLTRRGGALKAWGISFVLLGAVALAVGAFAAGYGAGIVEEEMGRTVPHEPRAEAGAYLAVGGGFLVVAGLVMSVVGAPLLVGGAARATREADARPAGDARPWGAGRTALTLVGGFALFGLLLGFAFGQGPGGGAYALLATEEGRDGAPPQVVEAKLEGIVRGANLPSVGSVGAGEERREHVVAPSAARGTIEVVGGWEPGPVPASALVVVVEAEDASGDWRELVRTASDAEIVVTTGLVALAGDVRITLELPEGSGGEARYLALVRIIPE